MRVIIPPAPSGANPAWSTILDAIRRGFLAAVSPNEAVAQIMLRAPNGTVYEVTVDNAGTLSTAVNDGKTRP